MKPIPTLIISLIIFAGNLSAVPILFDLRDTSATSEIESGTILRNGVTATLTPIVFGSSGVLNQTGAGFGVNANGTGDVTNLLDGALGAESISISFSQDILFVELGLSSFSSTTSGTDATSLTISGFSPISLIPMAPAIDIYPFSSDNLVAVGSSVLLSWSGYNGFSFDRFKIEKAPSASVPESGTTLAFLGLGAFGLILLRRFGC